jgi:hypothetical protein
MCNPTTNYIAKQFTPFYKPSKYKVSSVYSAMEDIGKHFTSIKASRVEKIKIPHNIFAWSVPRKTCSSKYESPDKKLILTKLKTTTKATVPKHTKTYCGTNKIKDNYYYPLLIDFRQGKMDSNRRSRESEEEQRR